MALANAQMATSVAFRNATVTLKMNTKRHASNKTAKSSRLSVKVDAAKKSVGDLSKSDLEGMWSFKSVDFYCLRFSSSSLERRTNELKPSVLC